jgi:predicted dinucleotide-utilizing enzyme
MVLRVAVGGFGAIGKVVAEALDDGIEGLSLAAVSARDTARAETAMSVFNRPAPVRPLDRLWEDADIIVECAPAQHLRDLAEPALANARTLVTRCSTISIWLTSRAGRAGASWCRPVRCWRSTRCRRRRSAVASRVCK